LIESREAEVSARERAEEAAREKQKERLAELEKIERPMQTVVMDGDKRVAYLVGKRHLEITETVVSIPFSKLLILLGQMLTSIIAPAFAGVSPVQTHGGSDDKSDSILS
jgi:hypothetical protein